MNIPFSAFVIAAPKSNSGKTIVTLGLLKALRNRGYNIQPFKSGPDYIDPKHHTLISGRNSYNLDCWMSSKEHVQSLFSIHTQDTDIAILEGAMGLFDGAKKDKGSVADLAKLLNLPIVLVVDAASTAYSIAPLLYGFKHFDKNIKIKGVIFNKVGSPSHYNFLKDAASDVGIRSLGYLPRNEKLKIDSRHLGLFMPQDLVENHPVNIAAQLIAENIDLDLLLKETQREKPLPVMQKKGSGNLRIAFARDKAFNFSYPANRDVLSEFGEICFFSPLEDTTLPEADLVWLSGGYPELFLQALAENVQMKEQISKHISSGKALVAECGGMMYLGKEIIAKDGQVAPMVGAFSLSTSFEKMKLHLGYRQVTNIDKDKHWFGHEFHYSDYCHQVQKDERYLVKSARNTVVETPVYRLKNCWASYMHLYLGEREKMQSFLQELGLTCE